MDSEVNASERHQILARYMARKLIKIIMEQEINPDLHIRPRTRVFHKACKVLCYIRPALCA